MQQRRNKHIVRRVLICLLALILLAAAAFAVIPMTETVKAKTAEGSADWMAELDDSLRLNEIVLPGTHDSATQYVQLAYFSKCQALSIREQLEAGFRYLDIRLGLTDEGFKLMHRLHQLQDRPAALGRRTPAGGGPGGMLCFSEGPPDGDRDLCRQAGTRR